MPAAPNTFHWDGRPGHYEVYYLALTDPATGVGAWLRYTMVAPLERAGRSHLEYAQRSPVPDLELLTI